MPGRESILGDNEPGIADRLRNACGQGLQVTRERRVFPDRLTVGQPAATPWQMRRPPVLPRVVTGRALRTN